MRRLLIILIFVSFKAFLVSGQNPAVDSLTHLLENTTDAHKKVDLMNDIAQAYFHMSLEKGYEFSVKALELSTTEHYSEGKRKALTLKGYYFFSIGNYTEALKFYNQASAVSLPDDPNLGYNYVMEGNVYRALALYDSAHIYYNKAITLLTDLKSDHNLAFAYKNMGRLLVMQWKNKEAEEYFLKAMVIYEKEKNSYSIADTWFSLSEVNKNLSDYAHALDFINKGCQISEEINDDFLRLLCLIDQAGIKTRIGDYPKALEAYFKALQILKLKDYPQLLLTVYSSIGESYEALGQNDISLKYYFEALKIAEQLNMKYEIAKVLSGIAWIYKNQHSFKLAHEYVNRSLDLRIAIKDEHGISQCENVLGIIYLQENKYDLAIKTLEKSLALRTKIGHREGVSASLFNLGLVYEAMKEYDKALDYQTRALEMDKLIGNIFSLGISYNGMGSLYVKLKQYDKAEAFLKLADALAIQTRSKTLEMNNNYYWSDLYEAKGDNTKALVYYKKYSILNDSIYFDLGAQKLAEMEALYQIEKKDQEIDLLNKEKQIHENEIKLQKSKINIQSIVILSVIIGFVLVSLLAIKTYQYNRQIRKAHREITEQKEEIQAQSEELIEANQTIAQINKELESKIEDRTLALSQAYKELDTFFYRSSHDFRRPLTTFLGLAEVAKVTVKDVNALELFEKVRDTAVNLDKMLVKLQSISDVGSQQLVYREVLVKEIFDTVCDTFREELQRKGIKTSFEISMKEPFISYPAMVKIIIENLVENSIHFSGINNAFIKLKAYQNGEYFSLDIQDNGQGIAKEYLDRIFEMYFRGNERSKGNGLGLYIVKKAVEKLDGSITVSSIYQSGTTFTVMLPMAFPAISNRTF
jgi:signal transduction histidine kinase